MVATNLFMSYVGTTWTPLPSGTAITLDEVTEVDWDMTGEPEEWYADGCKFPKLLMVPRHRRSAKLAGGDIGKMLTIPQNVDGTFVTTLQDAVNGVGTGALTFTLTPCKVIMSPNSGQTGKFSTGSITLSAYSADGTTDPLSFVVAV